MSAGALLVTAPGVADHVRSVICVREDICRVRFCGRPVGFGHLGMCQPHYKQQRKHGVAFEKLPKVAIWQGARRHEYGETFYRGKKVYPHRLMYELVIGPIPKGHYVLHSCDHQLCVRPEHLRIGTQADNAHDMSVRGRWRNQSAAGPGNDPTAWWTRRSS